ncbi:MAG: HlyC/CorC family transporter [Myxococcaceae bacterium]|nr:HlyC/CorC family transporter [Myxococcaceae bacterium]
MDYVYLGLALLLVLANGFFVATEFAIVKIRKSRLQTLAEEGRGGAHTALAMLDQMDGYLSACQFGITLASLGLGWLGEPAFGRLLHPLFEKLLPGASGEQLAHSVAMAVGFAVITSLHIVVGEQVPKIMAIQKAEATTLSVALPMRLFYWGFYPGVVLLNGVASAVLKLFGLEKVTEAQETTSEEELRTLVAASAEAGAITRSRAELLERALSMLEKTVRQVLVPRSQVRYLDLEEPIEKNVADARAGGHTWLPVCRGNLDEIEGVVNVKDLFFLLSRGELRSLAQVQRPVLFVPENATLEQLLSEFRRRKRQMAVVVDEHGGTSGIVSIADVVAEVVGDIAELGRKVEEVRTLPGGKLELPGSTQLDDLEDRLGVEFDVEEGEVTTIAGYLMMKLNRVPQKADRTSVGEFDVIVEEMDGPRVVRVRVEPRVGLPPTPDSLQAKRQ